MFQQSSRKNRRKNLLTRAGEAVSSVRILAVVVALFIVLAILSPTFRTYTNVMENVMRPASIVGVIALGMTFILASKGLDLSVGSTAALASTLGVLAIMRLGVSIPAGVVITLAVGALVGLFNTFFITKVRVAPFIVTLGTLSIGRGLTLVFAGTSFTYGLPDAYRDLGRGWVWGLPIPLIVLVGLWVFSYYLFTQTRFGRYARAIGANEEAVRLAGVQVDWYKMFYYVYVGMMAALAGLLWSARANTIAVSTGVGAELDAIASVILGGTMLTGGVGSVTGSVLGAVLLSLLNNGLQLLGINTLLQRTFVGVIIIMTLAYRTWHDERTAKMTKLRMVEKVLQKGDSVGAS